MGSPSASTSPVWIAESFVSSRGDLWLEWQSLQTSWKPSTGSGTGWNEALVEWPMGLSPNSDWTSVLAPVPWHT